MKIGAPTVESTLNEVSKPKSLGRKVSHSSSDIHNFTWLCIFISRKEPLRRFEIMTTTWSVLTELNEFHTLCWSYRRMTLIHQLIIVSGMYVMMLKDYTYWLVTSFIHMKVESVRFDNPVWYHLLAGHVLCAVGNVESVRRPVIRYYG